MKNKREMILVISLVTIIVLIVVTSILFFKNRSRSKEKFIINDVTVIELPDDRNLEDNKLLYGNWNSKFVRVFEDNKELTSYNIEDKNIQIRSDSLINVCYIEDNELKCDSSNYAYIDNILYLETDSLYLANKLEVIFEDDYMILKSISDDSKYTLLYLKNE